LLAYSVLHEYILGYLVLLTEHQITEKYEVNNNYRFTPTPAHCASLSTQHIRPSGFSGCRSDGLELNARWTQEIRRVMLIASNSFF